MVSGRRGRGCRRHWDWEGLGGGELPGGPELALVSGPRPRQTPAFFYAVAVKVFQTQDLVANRHAHLGPGAGKVETEGMGSALCTQTADEGTLRLARDFVTS